MSCATCTSTPHAQWCPAGGSAAPLPLGDWLKDAACSLETADLFFPTVSRATPVEAQAICLSCPVRDECALHAVTAGEDYGVWGALTPNERRVYRKHLRKKFGARVAARQGASA